MAGRKGKFRICGNPDGIKFQAVNCNSFVEYERSCLYILKKAIKGFDTKHTLYGTTYLENFSTLRNIILKGLLKYYYNQDLVRFAEYQTLEIQIESNDRDDWYMAFLVIKSLKDRRRTK